MKHKIIIAEDDDSIANIIKMTLEIGNYEITHVIDGLKAMEFIKNFQFDLAILDIMLPYIDGYKLLEEFKKKNIPVIFLSAKSEVVDKVKGLRLGAEDYITKPFETIELLARVDTAIRRLKKKSNILSINDVTLDLEKHTVKKSNVVVELSPLEYELLEKLMSNPSLLFSRDQLLDIVWGYDYVGGSRTVDTHIQKLRAKLDFGNVIKTVHKFGYKLEDNSYD